MKTYFRRRQTEIVSPLWFLHFIVVRFGHDKGLGRINFTSVFLILQWQKKEDTIKKFLNFAYMNVSHYSLGILPSVCLCGHPYYKTSYKFGFEIWSYLQLRYNLDVFFLDIYIIQSACNVFMYPTNI